jgi:hypothetical protein
LSRNFDGSEQLVASIGRAPALSPFQWFRARASKRTQRSVFNENGSSGKNDSLANLTRRGEKVTVEGVAVTVHAQVSNFDNYF